MSHRPMAMLRGSAALALALSPWAVHAQESDGYLGEIVLGESKREIQTQTAVPVTELDQTEIDDRQAGTIAELVDSVPGVSLVNGSTPQGSGINIRGFGANSTYGTDQKVQVQVDGATVGAEELYRIGTQLFTDPELYRSVEVNRGTVGSFEYGSGIVGGVVRLETKDASDFTGGETGFALRQTLGYSSNGNGLLSSTILAWQPTEHVELLFNYVYRDQDNQEDGNGDTIENSAFDLPSYLAKGKLSFGESDQHSITLSYSDTRTSESDVPYDTFATTGATFGNVDRDVESQVAILSYNYNPVDNDLVDLEVTLSYANQEIDQEYVPGSSICEGPTLPCGFPLPPGGFAVVNADQQYETTKLLIKNTSFFNLGAVSHDLRTGIEFSRRKRLDAESAPGGTDDRVAVFAVDDMRFGGGWTVSPALRYESAQIDGAVAPHDQSYDNDALMGGLSVRYAFANGVALFGSAAYTESLPIIDDLTSPDFMVQSEKARTYEIGASYAAQNLFATGDVIALKANFYRTSLWDITSYTSSVISGTYPEEVTTQGLELEASYALENGFYTDLNANVVTGDERQVDGSSVDWRGVPADSVQLTVGKRFGDALDLSWEIAADKGVDNVYDDVGGFAVHNLRATWSPQKGVLRDTQIRVGLENLFDKDYTPYLSTRPAAGRNIKLTLAKTF
ncbi:TonB-dependent receptor [Sulfitobacter sp. LCG007]